MLIKVCGLKDKDQIEELDAFVDFVGFIFYRRSKRFVQRVDSLTIQAKKVGVFVNAEAEYIFRKVSEYMLDFIQLHGNETPEFCQLINQQIPVIKAFGIHDSFDFSTLVAYLSSVEYFLFDTQTPDYGGSGKSFNWRKLDEYRLEKSFILSGGISEKHLQEIISFNHPRCIGIDLNSGFELEPGNKNVQHLKMFINEVKKQTYHLPG